MSSTEPSDIAALVDHLDAADPEQRQRARSRLIDAGSDAVDTLAANLPLVDRAQQFEIIDILADIGSNRALSSLADFFRQHRDRPGNGELRATSLEAILSVADSEDVDRVFEFLVDIHTDPSPAVRERAIEGFGRVAGERARPFIEKGLSDEEPDVRQTARRVRDALDAGEYESLGKSTLSDRQLLKRLRHRAGSQLEFYRRELLTRDNAFELARELFRGDHPVPMRGLRLLHSIDDERVRNLAADFARQTSNAGHRAAALRLLADRLGGDATDQEIELIRRELRSNDAYVSLAAIEAAGTSGAHDLLERTIDAVKDPDEELALTAAEALTRGLSDDHEHLIPDIATALRHVRDRRRDDATTERVKTEAYLLRALRRLASPHVGERRELLDEVLESLSDAHEHRPILVTGLSLLFNLVPDAPEEINASQIPPERLQHIDYLREHPQDDIRTRATQLLDRLDRTSE